jgi:hypothetical protein
VADIGDNEVWLIKVHEVAATVGEELAAVSRKFRKITL